MHTCTCIGGAAAALPRSGGEQLYICIHTCTLTHTCTCIGGAAAALPRSGGEQLCEGCAYSSHARVVLLGHGADEQCAGYGRHRTKRKEKKQVNETKQHQFHTAYHVFTRTTIL